MESPFKRYLVDVYMSHLYNQSMSFLKKYFTNELMFEDESKRNYRSESEISRLEGEIRNQCERISRELVDELEAEGICTPQDFENKQAQAEEIQNRYLGRLEQFLRELQ